MYIARVPLPGMAGSTILVSRLSSRFVLPLSLFSLVVMENCYVMKNTLEKKKENKKPYVRERPGRAPHSRHWKTCPLVLPSLVTDILITTVITTTTAARTPRFPGFHRYVGMQRPSVRSPLTRDCPLSVSHPRLLGRTNETQCTCVYGQGPSSRRFKTFGAVAWPPPAEGRPPRSITLQVG
ncbi:hypothetical protein LZ32DRAFT_139079 [Colletotrichum eremochloae]|nr:hypothetical protein LZ32DRAFT_139079 [Colletotrichum eremochloae]